MSAFVVEDQTINKIVCFLSTNDDFGYALPNSQDPQHLGQAMLDLNVHAVNQRYNEHSESHQIDWHWEKPTVYAALKSLHCWLYQCTEGTVPESDLYIQMSQIAKEIERYIINQIPEYKEANCC